MEFRVTAGQVQRIDVFRQTVVSHRREEDRFHAGVPESVQCLVITEPERFVRGDCDAKVRCRERQRSSFQRFDAVGRVLRYIAQCQQSIEVDVGLGSVGQQVEFPLQVRVLFRGHETEVAAFKLRVLQMWEEPEDRQAGLCLQHRSQGTVQHLGTVREDQSPNVTVEGRRFCAADGCRALRYSLQAIHESTQREARALRTGHQHDGQVQDVRHMPGTGLRGDAADPVIEAHDPFRHRDVRAGRIPGKELLQPVLRGEVQVEVVAGDAERRPVEHGVDVVRSALEGMDPEAPPFQRRQHRAGDRGLPAAGGRRREQEFIHGSSP